MMVRSDNSFFYSLTADTLIISYNDGVRKLSVINNTKVDGTIESTANKTIDGKTSQQMTISQDETITITPASESGILDNYKIQAPAGCTLKIIAQY